MSKYPPTVEKKSVIRGLMKQITAGVTSDTKETLADDWPVTESVDKGHESILSPKEQKAMRQFASSIKFKWVGDSEPEPEKVTSELAEDDLEPEPEEVVFKLAEDDLEAEPEEVTLKLAM